ncbi:DUF6328 family protein [Nocardioides alcanivorans]|uniref:DUF6328 family protein n=1 Tax=Nocardioides alcanivorans TaxID=2897352 RepID=UPI001F2BB800|nr:DUF6328 family protein [Nocardioides alcanivorans]
MNGNREETGRNETRNQRADRNWNDLLQEFRALQTGVQLLSGFLLTLPFHPTFKDLDDFQKGTYLGLVVLAACTTSSLLAPIAVHRQIFRRQRKQRLVAVGHVMARVALALIGALVTGTVFFVFDIVLDRGSAIVVGTLTLALVLVALVALPLAMARPGTPEDSTSH